MKPRHRLYAVILFVTIATHQTVAHDVDSSARYLGNEGVLVVHDDLKILFDAFYTDSHGQYVLVDPGTQKAIKAGQKPYDGIDAVFVSHAHGDHFSVEPTLDYLAAHPAVCLFVPEQVADLLRAELPHDDLRLKQIFSFDVAPGDAAQKHRMGKLLIEAVNVPHSGGKRMAGISNLVFRVTLGDWPTVMHMGDAGPDEAYFASLQSHWDARSTDLALPPYWFFLDSSGVVILDSMIKPRQSVGIHVPAEAIGHGAAWRKRAGGDLFTDPGEWRSIKRDE